MPTKERLDKQRQRDSAMSLFQKRVAAIEAKEAATTDEEAKDWRRDILNNIAYSGQVDADVRPFIAAGETQTARILDRSSGRPRIKKYVIDKFNLILVQPERLHAFSNVEIRCCLCRKVILYPAWYHVIEYNINHIHYFVCYDPASPGCPTPKCYRGNV